MTGMITNNRSKMTSMMTDDRSMMTSVNRGCIGTMTTMSSEVVGTGSCNSRLVDRSDSSVRMRHQLRHVDGTVMTSMSMTNSSGMTNSRYCSVRSICSMTGVTGVTMSGQMVCTGGSHRRLVDWGDSAVGMRLKAVKSIWRSRHTTCQCYSSKNQKLHFICARAKVRPELPM